MSWFTYKVIVANERAMHSRDKVEDLDGRMQLLHNIFRQHAEIDVFMHGYVALEDDSTEPDLPDEDLVRQAADLRQAVAGHPAQQALADSLELLLIKKLAIDQNIRSTVRQSPDTAVAMMQNNYRSALQAGIADVHRRLLDEERLLMDNHVNNNRFFASKVYYLSIAGSMIGVVFLIVGMVRFIVEHARNKVTEENLRKSEIKYRRLIEDAEVIMYTTNRGGYFTYISPKVESITGHTNTELLGKHYSLFLDEQTQKELAAHYEEQAGNHIPSTTREFRIKRKNGTQIWVEQQAMLIWEGEDLAGYQCIVKDVDERKRFQEQLIKSQEEKDEIQIWLQSILDNTNAIIFIKDLNSRYLLVNKKFEEMFHIDAARIIGHSDQQFPHIFDVIRADATDRQVLDFKIPVEMDNTLVHQGRKHYYMTTKFPLRDHQQKVFGLCGISTDISERIAYEHELIAARRDAEAAKRAQETFMANMSHEIRTPMNGIIGMTNLMHKTTLQAEQREFIDAIKDSANNLLVIINDILDFSKIKSGKMAFEKTNFDIRYIIRKTVYPFNHKAHEKGLDLVCRVDDAVPSHLIGDPVRLRQILENLLSNAIKFTEKGAITLTAALRSIDDMYARICFEVRDTGIGIPADMLAEVFESFTQSHPGIDRKYGGTGLGLAICKQLVTLQQGEISLESTVGKGTTLRFEIPYTRNLFTQPETTIAHEVPQVNLNGKEILVAEDNLINQKVALHTLKRAGANVEIVSDGAEAVEKVKEHEYDCILMDIQMPEIDGLKATGLIRELGCTTPIIAMTASAIDGEKENCVRAGMTDYISKPFIPEELYKKIHDSIIHSENTARNRALMLEQAELTALVDLQYLQMLANSDRGYLMDLIDMFRSRTKFLLEQMLVNAQQQQWTEIAPVARQLRAELNTIRIIPLIALLLQIEEHAMQPEHTDTIEDDILLAIKLYEEADEILKQEVKTRF
ncbi:PAS domain S-box protein [uncultured Chitinophaga sp.]|uniref:PAS domain S-box protein n=1 Tax=uncultured Chitinophaga sp. TaxID=339340 RepID=UPI0025FE8024|nr:PAS domain S-box protein [uncultured Chitinophaga sp.]